MNPKQKQFTFNLLVLYNLIQDSDHLKATALHIKTVQEKSDTVFINIAKTDTSELYTLKRVLEETVIIPKSKITAMDSLNQLLYRFSALTQMDNEQWNDMVDMLCLTRYRVVFPTSTDRVNELARIKQTISANPWALMILLIECVPYNDAVLNL